MTAIKIALWPLELLTGRCRGKQKLSQSVKGFGPKLSRKGTWLVNLASAQGGRLEAWVDHLHACGMCPHVVCACVSCMSLSVCVCISVCVSVCASRSVCSWGLCVSVSEYWEEGVHLNH